MSCINPVHADHGTMLAPRGNPMRRFAMKALFTALNLDRAERTRIDWDRRIVIFSTAVTIGLIALYVYGKATSRW
ncbi:hypothetical protein XH98_32135 [Bradyrhizobium sp. CCBAU 51745]|nr:hypothetical protein [Bradyrhizobium sp. CCBAU 51745]